MWKSDEHSRRFLFKDNPKTLVRFKKKNTIPILDDNYDSGMILIFFLMFAMSFKRLYVNSLLLSLVQILNKEGFVTMMDPQ